MKHKRIATLFNGDEVDLDELINHSGWKGAEPDKVTIISEKGDKFLATIEVSSLINFWIAREIQDYEDYQKDKVKLRGRKIK